MKLINLISIAMLVFILFFVGCIENKPTRVETIVPTPTPTPTPKLYIDMDFQQFVETMQLNKATILQKQNLYSSSIGKYVRWTGEIVDVTRITIQLKYVGSKVELWSNSGDLSLFVTEDQVSELTSFNRGDKITFEGMITRESFPYAGNGDYSGFRLFNGKIISKR